MTEPTARDEANIGRYVDPAIPVPAAYRRGVLADVAAIGVDENGQRYYVMATEMPASEDDDEAGAAHLGICDGCPSGQPQTVRTVRGSWGVATVCRFHETSDQ